MKPSWDEAPEWANWLAMDAGGLWWWYEREPHVNVESFWPADGKFKIAENTAGWLDTLERRP